MKKLLFALSVVAVSFALQAGDGACTRDKAACGKPKAAACEKAADCEKTAACEKAAACDKAKSADKGCCPADKKGKKPAKA